VTVTTVAWLNDKWVGLCGCDGLGIDATTDGECDGGAETPELATALALE
jgi:hypothetical protein